MRRAAESALLAREKQFFNPAPFLPTQQINKEVGLRTILFQTLLPLSFFCWQTSASKIKPTGPNIVPYHGSFFSFSPGVLMCAHVAQHPDTDDNNLVYVCLYMLGRSPLCNSSLNLPCVCRHSYYYLEEWFRRPGGNYRSRLLCLANVIWLTNTLIHP